MHDIAVAHDIFLAFHAQGAGGAARRFAFVFHVVRIADNFSPDEALRKRLLKELPLRYENIYASTSVPDNVEINQIHANKGEALMVLADYLGVPRDATMAFGDGLNDLSMIKDAGIGVAMANACDEAKELAGWIAPSCDEAGVAWGINKFCFGEM